MFNSFTTVQLPVSCPSLTASYICHHSTLPTFNLFFHKYQLPSNDANVFITAFLLLLMFVQTPSTVTAPYCQVRATTRDIAASTAVLLLRESLSREYTRR